VAGRAPESQAGKARRAKINSPEAGIFAPSEHNFHHNDLPSLNHFRFSEDRKSFGPVIVHNLLNIGFRIVEFNGCSTRNKVGICINHPIHMLSGNPYLLFGIRSAAPRDPEFHHSFSSKRALLDAEKHKQPCEQQKHPCRSTTHLSLLFRRIMYNINRNQGMSITFFFRKTTAPLAGFGRDEGSGKRTASSLRRLEKMAITLAN
jgi:hypothetical protein